MISGDSNLCGGKQDQEKVKQIGRKWRKIFYKLWYQYIRI